MCAKLMTDKPSFIPLSIVPLSLVCGVGASPQEIYANVETGTSRLKTLDIQSVDVDTQLTSLVYGAHAFEFAGNYFERILALLERSLTDALPNLQPYLSSFSNLQSTESLVLLQLPPTTATRYQALNIEHLKALVGAVQPIWSNSEIKLSDANSFTSASQLFAQRPELKVIFMGAVDSLFHPPTISELEKNSELWTNSHSQGIALGEAAGWALVTRQHKNAPFIVSHASSHQGAESIPKATENLQLNLVPNILIKLYGNTREHIDQQQSVNLRFCDKKLDRFAAPGKVQLVDLSGHAGAIGSASFLLALAYLTGKSACKVDEWRSALVLSHDLQTNTANSFLINQGVASYEPQHIA